MNRSERIHDLIIIGGGPAGLSAAINAESERVDTLVVDDSPQIGGQAGTTSLIENYPGFPQGINGPDLMARIVDQALRFDTEFMGPTRISGIERTETGLMIVHADDREVFQGRYVLLSTGVETRQLRARNVAAYRGRGVTYGPPSQSVDYHNKTVYIVGGGNSAGQAAYKLSEFDACDVHILIRGDSVEENMSGYLIDKLKTKSNIIIHTNTELSGVDGNGHLDKVTLLNKTDNTTSEEKADGVFVFIGAVPKTNWLSPAILRDEQGFVLAGSDLSEDARSIFVEQTKGRKPYGHETSMPGVFVAGDVRSGTGKRVALAVGDGVAVVPEIHRLRSLNPS
jgi:thioredoxin reductase (NADPH)